ncbi:MAG: hypothetical protein JRJ87_01430 [Deltaproteobacteria bacterium]|nr:hypothetical protein [Deltaproteobacteria bacterium]
MGAILKELTKKSRAAITFLVALVCAGLLSGCGSNTERSPVCIDDGDPLGPPCLELIVSEADFELIAKSGQTTTATKYMLPVDNDIRFLPLVFQNSKRFNLHIEFLIAVFVELFGELTPADYLQLIYNRATRTYYSGGIQRIDDIIEGRLYGFNAWTDLSDPVEQLELKEIRKIYQAIKAEFGPEKLVYMPTDNLAIEKARSWISPDFPVYLGWDSVATEVYTAGTCYGRVRRYTLSEFESAIRLGLLSWQDIVVIDQVPFDIETVVASVVTGGRQWELSHVNVRMARRGTPNLYVKDAISKFEEFDGQLVRLEATKSSFVGSDDRYTVSLANQTEAEAWWSEHRPNIGTAPEIDDQYSELDNLLEMDVDDQPMALIRRFGGKAANLAKLFDILQADYRVPAFGVPFSYFTDFMNSNTLLDTRLVPAEEVSYAEYVNRLVADERFISDALYRRQLLWDLRSRMEAEGRVAPELITAISQRIEEVFGSAGIKVRFRSSSNVEDALEFSGAGLYDSTSVCVLDNQDQDDNGPSWCDHSQAEERTIQRGLKKVWASLYNARAWEEREWYQIPHELAGMAILVSQAFTDERANGVAMTGNPSKSTDERYLINVQLGEEPVVGNYPEIVPERDLLKLDDQTGQVEKIYRDRTSILAEPGVYVLSDQQLEELGAVLFEIDRDYPLDTEGYRREQILLDLEFKIDSTGQLKTKQIRPFLDKCRQVRCSTPPDDYCQDENTLIDYRTNGTCDSGTGDCNYVSLETNCENGCLDGACQ